jgi:hypothetical protein
MKIMTTTMITSEATTMTNRAKRFGPDRVRNAVFTVTAAAFALAFAAVSGGGDSTTELGELAVVDSSAVLATAPQAIIPAIPSSAATVVQVEPNQPTVRRQVVVPFPRARTRAS